MREEDQPSRSIWLDDEALGEHFESVKSRYRTNQGGDRESIPDPSDMAQNELTRGLR